jgi:phosphatidylethanolamine-binding protein (PEBP) family uncharacterized protein
MISLYRIVGSLLLGAGLGACTGILGSSSLRVEYSWAPQNRCSSVSPEIRVSGIPPATKNLEVSLIDRNMPEANYGGGIVKHQGANVIPAGALQRFHGPCPQSEQREYTIRVQAIDDTGLIIGEGKKTVACCR